MKALIVYYTMGGSTGIVTKEIKKHFNFHVWEAGIRRVKAKTNFIKVLFNTMISKPVEIGHGKCHLDEYDIILIGTPVWAGKPNAAVLAFIDNLPDCKDKKFICFSVSLFEQNKAAEILSNMITQKNGTVIGTYSFKTKNLKKNLQDEVEKFLDILNVLESV